MPVPYEMTIPRSIILVCLVLAAIVFSSLMREAEASRYHSDDIKSKNPYHRHRHRHDGTSVQSSRRNHDFATLGRGPPWPKQNDDYEDAFEADDDDDEEDEDYEMERSRTFHEKSYQPSRNIPRNHHSSFEPRFSPRHHQTSGSYGDRWYRGGGVGSSVTSDDDPERRRWHYEGAGTARSQRLRPGRERTHHDDRRLASSGSGYSSRSHGFDDSVDDDPEDELIAEREVGYDRTSRRWRFDDDNEDDSQDYRATAKLATSTWRNFARHRGRQEARRTDWKSRNVGFSSVGSSLSSVQRMDDDDWTDRRRKAGMIHRGGKRPSRLPIGDSDRDELDNPGNDNKAAWGNKRSKNNMIDRGFSSVFEREKDTDDMDYLDYEDVAANAGETTKLDKRRKEQEEKEEEEDEQEEQEEEEEDKEEEDENMWKDAEKNSNDEDNTFHNTNYYKAEDEPPYKTFDDIIKSLTSDEPTTSKPVIRRDYRNIGIEKYLKRDAYGNIYDSRNATLTRIGHDTLFIGRSTVSSNKWHFKDNKPDITNYSNVRDGKKISNTIVDVNGLKGRKENEKKKVYPKLDEKLTRTKSLEQEYDEDYENNEKDNDAAKIGGEHVAEMQADINNTDYADEENQTETEDETSAPLVTSLPITSTTSTTTTTTTTTPRPIVTTRPTVIAHERRDSRSYDTSSGSQTNGLQQQSVHSVHKWQSLNTRDSSKDWKGHSQQNINRNGNSAEIKEALQHARKVSREGSCQWPRARVIPVRDVYPSPSTTYIPHCAILHRCSDDTGCCRSESLTCVPKVSHRVELYFYTTSIGGASVVEKLSFYNHTECECKERDDYGTSVDKTSGTNEHRFTRHHTPAVSPPQNIRRPPQRKPCRCPSEFTPRITPEGECQCSCFENHQNCIRTRRGKGYFSLRDRLCIQNEECATPTCEFGEYMRRQGKCPRKKDKFDAIANHPSNVNLHQRFRS